MTTVVCAYQPGRGFNENYVIRLLEQVRAHSPGVPFMCITNAVASIAKLGIRTMAMQRQWRDFWCKLEAFRVPGPCLYMDLDVTIMGDLEPLLQAAANQKFVALERFGEIGINTSVMAWAGNVSDLYNKCDPRHARIYKQHPRTDEWYVYAARRGRVTKWQDICPGMLMSYKREWEPGEMGRDDCRILYFHGRPRPWEIPEIESAAA